MVSSIKRVRVSSIESRPVPLDDECILEDDAAEPVYEASERLARDVRPLMHVQVNLEAPVGPVGIANIVGLVGARSMRL